jgi:hypothetical protein
MPLTCTAQQSSLLLYKRVQNFRSLIMSIHQMFTLCIPTQSSVLFGTDPDNLGITDWLHISLRGAVATNILD